MPSLAEIESLIRSTAQAHGVDPNLAVALARRESSLNPAAVGSAGEVGIFQLTAGAAQDVGVNRYSLEGNILGGVLYLQRLLNQFGDPYLALAAYNAGPGNVSRGVIPVPTQTYATSILAASGYGATPTAGPNGNGSPVFSTTVWGEPIYPGAFWPWLLAGGFGLFLLASFKRKR